MNVFKHGNRFKIQFRGIYGERRRLCTPITSKDEAKRFGSRVVRLVEARLNGDQPPADLSDWIAAMPPLPRAKLESWGLLSKSRAQASKALTTHIDDWHQSMLDVGTTAKHAYESRERVLAIVNAHGWERTPDIDAEALRATLAAWRRGRLVKGKPRPMSNRTSNAYLMAIKSFLNWMRRYRGAGVNPLDCVSMQDVRLTPRRERRALTDHELRSLIASAQAGPERFGVSGPERAIIYELAATTGLRASEIRSLVAGDFDLSGPIATVKLEASLTKNRRADVMPLRPGLAKRIEEHLQGKMPTVPAFKVPTFRGPAMMIALDLAEVGLVKLGTRKITGIKPNGMPYHVMRSVPEAGPDGKWIDFHCLRHTFATNLARAGVAPKVAQDLLRHSDINMTMKVYTHTLREDRLAAMERLPDVSGGQGQEATA